MEATTYQRTIPGRFVGPCAYIILPRDLTFAGEVVAPAGETVTVAKVGAEAGGRIAVHVFVGERTYVLPIGRDEAIPVP